MSKARFPSYDPGHGVLTRRGGRWVETWNLRNGVAWRDPVLAERAVASWHQRRGDELRDAEVHPVLLQRLMRRIGGPRRVLSLSRRMDQPAVAVTSEPYSPADFQDAPERRALQQVGS